MANYDLGFLILNWIPILRRILRWVLCRKMEVIVRPYFEDEESPYSVSVGDGQVHVHAILRLQLINHNDKPERIIGCSAHLRKRHLLLWHRTIAETNVQEMPDDLPFNNLLLEPYASPYNKVIRVSGGGECPRMPHKSELVLIFKMVGQMRRFEYKLQDMIHDPKRHQEDSQSPQ